jgi:amino acid transporter
MGPLLGALSVAPLIAISAGFSAPFIVLVCGIAMFIVALTIARFARVLPSAASIYSYVSHGLGERTGFLSAWLSFMYYVLFVPRAQRRSRGADQDRDRAQRRRRPPRGRRALYR